MDKHKIVLYAKGGAESRSSRPELFYEKDVLKNFAKPSGKHLY